MVAKALLLVCLLPLAFAGDMFGEYMMGDGMGDGGSHEDKDKDKDEGGMDMGGMDMGGMDFGGMEGGGDKHYYGDGDCQSEEEAEMKKKMFMKMMMMHKYAKMKAMMKKKAAMKEAMEKFMKFKSYLEKMHEKKEEEAKEHKEKMKDMYKKFMWMKEKKQKAEDLKDMMEEFKKAKHMMAFKLTHAFLGMCKCGEINMQMQKMAYGMMSEEGGDLTDDMAQEDAMSDWETGDMAALAEKLKKLSKEQKKKLFMAGLIKSMCAGAKTFVVHAKQFEEKFMSD